MNAFKVSDIKYENWQRRLTRGGWFKFVFVLLGVYGVLFYAAIGIYLLAMPQGWRVAILLAFAALFNRYVVCEIIDYFHPKPHPYQRLKFKVPVAWVFFSSMDGRHDAFPSEHASCAAAISFVLMMFFPHLGAWAFLAAAVMGLARVVIGYHDLYDVAGGLVIGVFSGYLVYIFMAPLLFTPH